MNKTDVLALVERLADKTGKDIVLLNDVLKYLESKKGNTRETFLQDEEINDNCGYLMQLWYACLKDHSVSLQTVIDKADYACDFPDEPFVHIRYKHIRSHALKLCEYLEELFPSGKNATI